MESLGSLTDWTDCPFPAWQQYLPATPYAPQSPVVGQLEAATQFLASQAGLPGREQLWQQRWFPLIVATLLSCPVLARVWPDLAVMLEEEAEQVLSSG